MRTICFLLCVLLLLGLCACAEPAAEPEVLPEPAVSVEAEPLPEPEPVPEITEEAEPEPEAAVLPAEPVWVLGRLTDAYSTRESEWIRAEDVPEDVPEDAPMQTLNEVFTGEETLDRKSTRLNSSH